jgi:hypothetical protein
MRDPTRSPQEQSGAGLTSSDRSNRRLPDRREEPAIALRTDWAVNQLARGGRLELGAFGTFLVALRLILIRDRALGYLDCRAGSVRLSAKYRRRAGSTHCVL